MAKRSRFYQGVIMKRTIVLIASLLVALQCRAVDTEELRQLVGFTVIAVTEVPGEFEGGDFDKTVKLANEMVFEFMSYGYMYAYQPATAVFAKKLSPEQQAKLG